MSISPPPDLTSGNRKKPIGVLLALLLLLVLLLLVLHALGFWSSGG